MNPPRFLALRMVFNFIREPIIIVSFIVAVLIVCGAYFGSHYYYGDVETVDIQTPLTFSSPPVIEHQADFSGLDEQAVTTPAQTQSTPDISMSDGISTEAFLAEYPRQRHNL